MAKIDRRINYRIVLDTETCPLNRDLEEITPTNMLVYDCGWAVVDKYGKVYKTQSFVIADVYLNEKVLMQSAYYSNKIPLYEADLKAGTRKLVKFATMRKALIEDMREYGVTEVYAHNMRFDIGALNNTIRWLTKSQYRYFFPFGTEICDTLKMARQVVAKTPTYKAYCKEHDYLTKNNQMRLTAEVLYRYITNNTGFIESHTALEDVLIEKEILRYCFAKHKKMQRAL